MAISIRRSLLSMPLGPMPPSSNHVTNLLMVPLLRRKSGLHVSEFAKYRNSNNNNLPRVSDPGFLGSEWSRGGYNIYI